MQAARMQQTHTHTRGEHGRTEEGGQTHGAYTYFIKDELSSFANAKARRCRSTIGVANRRVSSPGRPGTHFP